MTTSLKVKNSCIQDIHGYPVNHAVHVNFSFSSLRFSFMIVIKRCSLFSILICGYTVNKVIVRIY